MLKKRKDDGFTLIELMIVIAVIGILAIVLIPKVGTIKTQAKSAGLETNMRMIQGYVESRITYWNDKQIDADDIAADIEAVFEASTDKMKNPFATTGGTLVQNALNATPETLTADTAAALQIDDAASTSTGQGVIEVVVAANADPIIINAKNNNGTVYSSVTVNP